jgi:ribosomal-protein-alanine N-acetyltransferase
VTAGRAIPELETERLRLTAWREDHLDAYAAITANAEVMHWMGRGPFDREDAWREIALYLGHFHLRGYTHWALELKETGELVGRCGPWRPEGWPALEVGWLLSREHWGNGYATEAARTAVAHAWNDLKADRVISLVAPQHERSAAVARRLGAQPAGTATVRGLDALVFEHPAPAH